MRREIIYRLFFTLVQVDLQIHRIRLQKNEAVGRREFRCGQVAAVEVDDQGGFAVQLQKLRLGQAEIARVIDGVVSPVMVQVKARHDVGNVAGGPRRPVVLTVLHELAGGAAMGLDIENLIAKLLQADEVVNRLPRDAGDGKVAQEAEHDNFGFHFTASTKRLSCSRLSSSTMLGCADGVC